MCEQPNTFFKPCASSFLREVYLPIAHIDESQLSRFIGNTWVIEEHDERNTSIGVIEIDAIRLAQRLARGEGFVNGEERIERLKRANFIRLGIGAFITLRKNVLFIPLHWRKSVHKTPLLIFFDGTVLRNQKDDRHVVGLTWGNTRWLWGFVPLDSAWGVEGKSAVVPPSK
jgi:hypothetical protein